MAFLATLSLARKRFVEEQEALPPLGMAVKKPAQVRIFCRL